MRLVSALPAFAASLASSAARGHEEPRYTVLRQYDGFEVREYAPYLVAETRATGEFGEARNAAFRRLFDFISGANEPGQRIDMTVPVTSEAPGKKIDMTVPVTSVPAEDGRTQVMRFMLPSKFTLQTAPRPRDSRIAIREVESKVVAALRYSGWSSQSSFDEHRKALLDALRAANIAPRAEAVFAVYNSPFTPWFLRRNEVLVEIERPQGSLER